jgi:hypothetical protein
VIIADVLVAASFIAAAYMDIRTRMIADVVWIPAVIGTIINIATSLNTIPLIILEGTALFIGILMISMLTLLKIGYLATGDVIIMGILVLNPLYYVFIGAMAAITIIAVHGAYLLWTKQINRKITVARFKKEAKWLPIRLYLKGEGGDLGGIDVPRDANNSREWVLAAKGVTDDTMLEVNYGTPMVGYLGVSFVIGMVLWHAFGLPGLFPFLSNFTL